MNKQELIETILSDKELKHLTKKDANQFVNTLIETVRKSVKKGEDVSLVGFGTFTKARRKARTGVNPSTGAKINIKAKNVPKFRPGKDFKDYVA